MRIWLNRLLLGGGATCVLLGAALSMLPAARHEMTVDDGGISRLELTSHQPHNVTVRIRNHTSEHLRALSISEFG